MFELSQALRATVELLLVPTLLALGVLLVAALFELGSLLGERFHGLRALAQNADPERALALGHRRIERADLITRAGPMLGLMGTLISLGPGLEALARGDVARLAGQVTIAFDTTVVGLCAGIVGFLAGRLRRRWYGDLVDALERADAPEPRRVG
ncbi:MAG: MotA/TolQ/ExbB proton channel family protein [Proteobacteria bacterium]|nr:MotA/TolQ/ExbB proton channel family protein [Pseudomonadota bacterium]